MLILEMRKRFRHNIYISVKRPCTVIRGYKLKFKSYLAKGHAPKGNSSLLHCFSNNCLNHTNQATKPSCISTAHSNTDILSLLDVLPYSASLFFASSPAYLTLFFYNCNSLIFLALTPSPATFP